MTATIQTDDQAGWQVYKLCTDVGNYELLVEKQKTHSACTQKRESWKWSVAHHGTIVSSGSVNSLDLAKEMALANVPGGK